MTTRFDRLTVGPGDTAAANRIAGFVVFVDCRFRDMTIVVVDDLPRFQGCLFERCSVSAPSTKSFNGCIFDNGSTVVQLRIVA